MANEEVGPLTDAFTAGEEGKPPDVVHEWHGKLSHAGEYVFIWGGAVQGVVGAISWLGLHTHYGEPERESSTVTDTPAENVERLLSPPAHAGRIKIMQALFRTPLSASDLSQKTGLRGGALYHHLRELKYGCYLTDTEEGYGLTALGRQLLLAVTLIASAAVRDRGEDGLAVGANWEKADRS